MSLCGGSCLFSPPHRFEPTRGARQRRDEGIPPYGALIKWWLCEGLHVTEVALFFRCVIFAGTLQSCTVGRAALSPPLLDVNNMLKHIVHSVHSRFPCRFAVENIFSAPPHRFELTRRARQRRDKGIPPYGALIKWWLCEGLHVTEVALFFRCVIFAETLQSCTVGRAALSPPLLDVNNMLKHIVHSVHSRFPCRFAVEHVFPRRRIVLS